MSVVVYHFNMTLSRVAPAWIPDWIAAVVRQGGLGVEVFFVISGFVIAFSVREGVYTAKYLGLFALRRSIRLDPLYWFAIALELATVALISAYYRPTPFPSIGMILAHLIYAQDLLGYPHILPVFWTLCYEIQFYLMFVGLLVVWGTTESRLSVKLRERAATLGWAALFAVSLCVNHGWIELPIHGLALERWFQFFLGVLTWWVMSRRVSWKAIAVAYVAIAASIVAARDTPIQLLPVVVSAFILAVNHRHALGSVLGGRVLQFLGKISYSLYVFHRPIAERWIVLLESLLGPRFDIAWAWVAFITALAIALVVSELAWRFIEAPTMRLSKRIRLPSKRTRLEATTLPAAEPVPALGVGLG